MKMDFSKNGIRLNKPSSPIAIFGASGRTGQCVLQAANAAGLACRGLVRTPGALRETPAIEVVGSTLDEQVVAKTLKGCAAVCLLLGPRPPYTEVFCAEATQVIVNASQKAGVTRLISQTGAMIGDYPNNRSFLFQAMAGWYQRKQPAPHQDRVQQEQIVRDSGLDWTILKPPRLTMGKPTQRLLAGSDVKVGLLSSASRWDLGKLVVQEILRPSLVERVAFIRG